MSSKLQSDGCYYYSQWWRHLANAYEVIAGMVTVFGLVTVWRWSRST